MQLLAQRKAQLRTTSKQELDGLRALIERDFPMPRSLAWDRYYTKSA